MRAHGSFSPVLVSSPVRPLNRPRALSDESIAISRMNSNWTRAFLRTVEDGSPTRTHRARQHREAHSRSLKIRGLLLGVEAAQSGVEMKILTPAGGCPEDSDSDDSVPLLPADATCFYR